MDFLRIVRKLINYSYTILMGLLYAVVTLSSHILEEKVPQQIDRQKSSLAGCGRTSSERVSI
jgi:hypothetical protein